MTENLESNLKSLKSCTPIPDFSAENKKKAEHWITNGIELGFSTKLFNKNNMSTPQVSF
jgi:hypothetical protein